MRNFIVILSFLYIPLLTQSQNTEDKLGTWYMLNTNNKISKSLSLKTSAHIRFFELAQFYQQEIYRAGLSYNANKRFSLTGGMVYSIKEENYKTNSNKTYEYRYYSDFNWKTTFNKLQLKPRIRLEHSANSKTDFEEFSHRIRFGATLQYPILKKTTLYFFDEVFFNFSDEIFGENRTGFGLTNSITDMLKIQLGFMHINQTDTFLNRLQVGLLLKTDFIDIL